MRKEFSFKKRDGTKAKFTFVKRGGFWFWDLPEGIKPSLKGELASLLLPDINLDQAKTLKECLDLIAEKRGDDWVGQVVTDLLKCKDPLDTSKK